MCLEKPEFKHTMDLIQYSKSSSKTLHIHEHEYLHAIMQAELEKHKKLTNLVYTHNASAPPCVIGIVKEWKEKWNNNIRFQLAGVLRSVSLAWDMDVMVLAEAFIAHMRDSGMAKDSIKHFETLCNRPLTIDTRPCMSRRMPYSVSPHELWCPFGGGEVGVTACLSTRNLSSDTRFQIEEATPSLIWSTTTAKNSSQ